MTETNSLSPRNEQVDVSFLNNSKALDENSLNKLEANEIKAQEESVNQKNELGFNEFYISDNYGNNRKMFLRKLEDKEKTETESVRSDTKSDGKKELEINPIIQSKMITNSLRNKKMSSFEEILWYRQSSVWMPFSDSKHKFEKSKIFEILKTLQTICIYDNIDVFDNLVNNKNATKNCFTIRNDCFQKVFYVGSVGNRTLGKYLAFTLRVVDQYSRHVLSIKKHYKNCCFGYYKVDIFFPDGTRIAKIEEKQRTTDSTIEFLIFGPNVKNIMFSIKRLSDSPVGHKFDIQSKESTIGTITKIFEKESLFESTSGDHYIRINFSSNPSSKDKAVILSAALIIDILFLRQIKRQ